MIIKTQHFQELKNHVTLTSCHEISDLMLPQLKQHGIKVFNYYRIYFDGTLVRLSTDREWSSHYFKKNYLKHLSISNTYLTKQLNYYIWLTEDCPEMLLDAAINFDTSNGISIAKIHADSIEYFCFASNLQNTRIVNHFYLNNLDILEKYSYYFKENASEVIKQHEKNKIILPAYINCHSHLKDKYPTVQLSKTQTTCARLILEGLKYKEIATNLKISERTVETHINVLKSKLHCRDKAQLILKLSKIL